MNKKRMVTWIFVATMVLGGNSMIAYGSPYGDREGGLQGDAGVSAGETVTFSWSKESSINHSSYQGIPSGGGASMGKTVPFSWKTAGPINDSNPYSGTESGGGPSMGEKAIFSW